MYPINSLLQFPRQFREILNAELRQPRYVIGAALRFRSPQVSDLLYDHPSWWPFDLGWERAADSLGVPAFKYNVIKQLEAQIKQWRNTVLQQQKLNSDDSIAGYFPYFYLKYHGVTEGTRQHLIRCFMRMEVGKLSYVSEDAINVLFVDVNQALVEIKQTLSVKDPSYAQTWAPHDIIHLKLYIENEDKPSYRTIVSSEARRYVETFDRNNPNLSVDDVLYIRAEMRLARALYLVRQGQRGEINEAIVN